jgi:hypothetical protein
MLPIKETTMASTIAERKVRAALRLHELAMLALSRALDLEIKGVEARPAHAHHQARRSRYQHFVRKYL